jgi:hypothetical protein
MVALVFGAYGRQNKTRLMQRIIWLLSCCLFCSSLVAQYDGGKGDGHDRSFSPQLSLDGMPQGVIGLYGGGPDDGVAVERISSALAMALPDGLYAGGRGDGFSQQSANASLSGQDLGGLYRGGDGDGFDREVFASSLTGEPLAGIYGGGGGDGHDVRTVAAFLNGGSLAGIYGGGNGDGFDVLALSTVLGQPLAMLYGGGQGDGFSKDGSSHHLTGTGLAGLFGGGVGDGYSDTYYAGSLPLPLTLLTFEAIPHETFVLLKWTTTDEVGTDFFTIEKTKEGRYFRAVGKLPAAGYSEPDEVLHYQLKDEQPYQGKSHYRLKTTDFDGYISYSHLLEVHYGSNDSWDFSLFPNPNTGRQLQIRLEGVTYEEEVQVHILDLQGRRWASQQLNGGTANQRLDLQQRLPAGSYLIQVRQADRSQQTKILIVKR